MITVVLREVSLGETGPLYEVTLNDEVIVRSHFAPEYPAARGVAGSRTDWTVSDDRCYRTHPNDLCLDRGNRQVDDDRR